MAKIFVIGTITDNVELKYSENKVPYVRFTLTERTKKFSKPQFFQVWAWYENAEDLKRENIGKGNTVQITGDLHLETYCKAGNNREDKRLKIHMDSCCIIPEKQE